MRFNINNVLPGQMYLHHKTKMLYRVISVSRDADTNEPDKYRVEYVRLGDRTSSYSRRAEDFCDGRFVRVSVIHLEELLMRNERQHNDVY